MGPHGSQWVTVVIIYTLSFFDIDLVKQGVYLLVIETLKTSHITTTEPEQALAPQLLGSCLRQQGKPSGHTPDTSLVWGKALMDEARTRRPEMAKFTEEQKAALNYFTDCYLNTGADEDEAQDHAEFILAQCGGNPEQLYFEAERYRDM